MNQPESYVTTIGDIVVSPHWVTTPSGQFPLRGTTWTVTDMSHQRESISMVGVILCIAFIWVCFIGLLFLLMKERSMEGYVQVTVQASNGIQHSAMIPAANTQTAWQVNQAVNYARSLAAVA